MRTKETLNKVTEAQESKWKKKKNEWDKNHTVIKTGIKKKIK